MTRTARLVRDVCLGIAALAAAGCGGKSSSASASSQTLSDFDFGNNDPRKVTAFGDSITQGELGLKRRGVREVTSNNYPNILQGKLQGLDPAWRVVNRGVGGERTAGGAARLPTVLQIDRPGFVLIMEGANDAAQCLDGPAAINNLHNMVNAAKANKTIPIIGTVTPSFRNDDCAHNIIDQINAGIHGFAAAEHVAVAEIFDGMNQRDLFGVAPDRDPLHPNEQGYAVMADIWFQAMLQAIPGGATTALRRRH
jgi:lysophospholipase L1-like esterase